MAKSTSFFGLRKGSTKSHTYQIGRTMDGSRQQVTKDRVTEVTNPRTASQQEQRMIFASATFMRKALRDVIYNSFEELPFGQPNLSFFTQQAISAFKARKNPSSPAYYEYNGKRFFDRDQVVVMPYLQSSGSLTPIELNYIPGTHITEGETEATPDVARAKIDLGITIEQTQLANHEELATSLFRAMKTYFGDLSASEIMFTVVASTRPNVGIADSGVISGIRFKYTLEEMIASTENAEYTPQSEVLAIKRMLQGPAFDPTISVFLRVEPKTESNKYGAYLYINVQAVIYGNNEEAGYINTAAVTVSTETGHRSYAFAKVLTAENESNYDNALSDGWPLGLNYTLNGDNE